MDRHPKDLTTDEEIDAALEKVQSQPEPVRIAEATYHRDLELFVLKLTNGARLVFPRENLQAVANATQEQAADFTTEPLGRHIYWPQVDEGHYLPNMLEGRTGNEKWMERLSRHKVAA